MGMIDWEEGTQIREGENKNRSGDRTNFGVRKTQKSSFFNLPFYLNQGIQARLETYIF